MTDLSARKINCVLLAEGVLLAIMSPLGFRSEWGSLSAYLKVAGSTALEVKNSELFFEEANGKVIERRLEAFGLKEKMLVSGPFSERFSDDAPRPEGAVTVVWRVNDLEVSSDLFESEEVSLRVRYLPLRVPVDNDPHIIVTVVNRTGEMLNIAEGVRKAACFSDGKRYGCIRGGHWDGSSHVQPRKAFTKRFSLSDFPSMPDSGRHEMSFEIFGSKSLPRTVNWIGDDLGS